MQCPTDQATLVMTERKGVEVDYCPQCRGVWLDRGELDKIIDRSIDAEIAAENARPSAPPIQPQQPVATYPAQPQYSDPRYDEPRYDDRRRENYDPRYGKKKRKESFLGELFDF